MMKIELLCDSIYWWILGGRFWGEMLSYFVLLCFHSKGIWFRNRVYLSKEIKYVLILIFHLIYILFFLLSHLLPNIPKTVNIQR